MPNPWLTSVARLRNSTGTFALTRRRSSFQKNCAAVTFTICASGSLVWPYGVNQIVARRSARRR
jgi:hypothetical protein